MTLRGWIGILLVCLSPLVASAQSRIVPPANEQYVPRLGDIMNTAQSRHMKLWFAGKARNWKLANYELRQLKASLVEAASLYPDLPVTSVTTMATPVEAVGEAIVAGDGARFAKTFGELTTACNGCHQSIARGFIVMRVPEASPFGNQVFPPRGKP